MGLGIEFIVAQIKGHEIQEGFLVSGFLIPLIVPVDTPLWMVAVATAFAVIFLQKKYMVAYRYEYIQCGACNTSFPFLCLSNLHVGRCGLGAYRINIRNGA